MPARNGGVRPRSSDVALPSEEILPLRLVNSQGPVVPVARVEPGIGRELSVRAINVLKMLAGEIMGETPPRDDWMPSEELLRKITVERLPIVRNCGPRTVDEIIRWAEARGVTIQPVFHAGKSLSDTWRDLSTRFTAGELTKAELTKAELAEALEKSVRRKSTKVPVAIQRILLKYLSRVGDDAGRA